MPERSISPYERYGTAHPDTDAALRVHVFATTDTLSGLAQKYLADWRLWRALADRNQIVDARRIATGTQLIIPIAPLEKGRDEL